MTFGATSLGAQASPVRFGIEAGAASAALVGDDAVYTDRRLSPFLGVTAITQRPGSSIGFQSGIQLVSKGASFDEEGFEGALRLRYLEVPLLLRFAPALAGSRLQPAVTVGGAMGLRIGCSVAFSGEGISGSVDCDDAENTEGADLKRFEAGVVVGAELGIPYRQRFLVVPMIRYTRGLTKIADSDTGDDDVRNSVIQVGVGLRFRQ
ncbi:MAG: porin family protein [Gemmatimonadota bacterium]